MFWDYLHVHSVEEEAFEAAALIIVLRLWRVVRIVNGAVLSSKAQSDRKLEDARAEARRIIHAFHKCQDKVDQLEVLFHGGLEFYTIDVSTCLCMYSCVYYRPYVIPCCLVA